MTVVAARNVGSRAGGIRRWDAGRIARVVVMLIVAAAFLYPLLGFFIVALRSDASVANGTGGPLGIGGISWDGIQHSWSQIIGYGGSDTPNVYLSWLGNTLVVAIGGMLIALVAALPSGYALAKLRFRFQRTLLVITLLAMVMPNTVLVIPLFLEVNAIGAVGELWPVAVLMGFYPFGVYLAYIHFRTAMPSELVEAARIDGLGEVAIFARIALPISKQAVALVAFFSFLANWTNFFLPLALLTSNLGSQTISVGIQSLISSSPLFNPTTAAGLNVKLYMPELGLATAISTIPLLVVFVVAQRFLVRGQTVGALKG
ncbi:carbohydrate ABC transporter permease [Pseudolysinimonas sp.]|uniref:carbohydrate ABC transporter permease n=1 Tax=Pseudolysinimonas sp. TaxID=2680009 RepID=UPI003F7F8596